MKSQLDLATIQKALDWSYGAGENGVPGGAFAGLGTAEASKPCARSSVADPGRLVRGGARVLSTSCTSAKRYSGVQCLTISNTLV